MVRMHMYAIITIHCTRPVLCNKRNKGKYPKAILVQCERLLGRGRVNVTCRYCDINNNKSFTINPIAKQFGFQECFYYINWT